MKTAQNKKIYKKININSPSELYKIMKDKHYNNIKFEKPLVVVGYMIDRPDVDKEPSWFKEFRIQNDKRWEEQNKFNTSILKFVDEQYKFNEDQRKFNKKIDSRLDNLVKMNNLKE